jgi:hypothetical protein
MTGGGWGTCADMTVAPGEPVGVPPQEGLESPGVPGEEGIESADVRDDIDTDPESVPNAPNRNPAEPPRSDDVGSGNDPSTPTGYESFEDQRGGNFTDPPR